MATLRVNSSCDTEEHKKQGTAKKGTLLALNISNNGIGGYGEADWAFVATPEGPEAVADAVATQVSPLASKLLPPFTLCSLGVAKANRGLQKLDISGNKMR